MPMFKIARKSPETSARSFQTFGTNECIPHGSLSWYPTAHSFCLRLSRLFCCLLCECLVKSIYINVCRWVPLGVGSIWGRVFCWYKPSSPSAKRSFSTLAQSKSVKICLYRVQNALEWDKDCLPHEFECKQQQQQNTMATTNCCNLCVYQMYMKAEARRKKTKKKFGQNFVDFRLVNSTFQWSKTSPMCSKGVDGSLSRSSASSSRSSDDIIKLDGRMQGGFFMLADSTLSSDSVLRKSYKVFLNTNSLNDFFFAFQ